MNQLAFDLAPRVHRDDPQTSHDAAERSSATWTAKHDDLIQVLRASPGLTATELAAREPICSRDPWPRNSTERKMEVRRRLSDLGPRGTGKLRRRHDKDARESRWFIAEGS